MTGHAHWVSNRETPRPQKKDSKMTDKNIRAEALTRKGLVPLSEPRIKDVKRVIADCFWPKYGKVYVEFQIGTIEEVVARKALQICQLFPKSADNPDGYAMPEPKRTMVICPKAGECFDVPCKHKVLHNRLGGPNGCGYGGNPGLPCQPCEPKPDIPLARISSEDGTRGVATGANKPDESRLLSPEERMNVDIPCETKCLCKMPRFDARCMDCIAICHEEAQLAKDKEWEARTLAAKDAELARAVETISACHEGELAQKDAECHKRIRYVEDTLREVLLKSQEKWADSIIKKDAECQAKVEAVFKEIEKESFIRSCVDMTDRKVKPHRQFLVTEKWYQDFKKWKGVK